MDTGLVHGDRPVRRAPVARLRDGTQPPRRRRRRSPATARWTAARCSSRRRTSRCSAVRWARSRAEDLQGHGPGDVSTGAPFIQINDSGGARIQEGAASLAGYGYIFERNVRASGVIPQISVIMGPCAGGAVYSPRSPTSPSWSSETSHMFITGPDVIKAVTGEEVTFEELGGAMTHASRSGVASLRRARTTRTCCCVVRHLLSFLPSNNLEDPPALRAGGRPRSARRGADARRARLGAQEPYDMHEVIRRVVDDGDFLEVFPFWAMNVVIGFARLDGRADRDRRQPAEGARRHARHRREREGARGSCGSATRSTSRSSRSSTCPGSCRAPTQEYSGIIRHGAKLLYAFAEATVPRLTVITRKAYGGRVPRHELEAPAGRRVVRVADRRDRRDGAGGRGERRVPQGDRKAEDPVAARGRADRRVPGASSRRPTSRPSAGSSTT